MPRKRLVSPEFFTHAGLYDAEVTAGLPLRLAFEGLWTQADRRGIFRWRARELKLAILPYDPVDFNVVLDALAEHGFVVRYEVDGNGYGIIPSLARWQTFHHQEKPSDAPGPPPTSTRDQTRAGPRSTRDQTRAGPRSTRDQTRANPTVAVAVAVTGTGTGTVASAVVPHARTEIASLLDRLPATAHPAADAFAKRAKNPSAWAAAMCGMLDGLNTKNGQRIEPNMLGQILVEIAATEYNPSPATVRTFLARIERDSGTAGLIPAITPRETNGAH